MAVNSTRYESVPTEMQSVMLDWVQATQAFYARYYQIDKIINSFYKTVYKRSKAGGDVESDRSQKIQQLIHLRQQMSHTLMTLLADMSRQQGHQVAGLSKPGKLSTHTQLLRELNCEVDTQLQGLIKAQA